MLVLLVQVGAGRAEGQVLSVVAPRRGHRTQILYNRALSATDLAPYAFSARDASLQDKEEHNDSYSDSQVMLPLLCKIGLFAGRLQDTGNESCTRVTSLVFRMGRSSCSCSAAAATLEGTPLSRRSSSFCSQEDTVLVAACTAVR